MLKNRLLPDSPTQAALKATNHVPNSTFPKSSAFQPEFISAKGSIARPGTNQNDASRILAELPGQSSSRNRHHNQATTRISTEHQKKRSEAKLARQSEPIQRPQRKRKETKHGIGPNCDQGNRGSANASGAHRNVGEGTDDRGEGEGSSGEFYLAALGS